MKNLSQTIITQYANSPVLLAVLNNWNSAIDPGVNLDNFYNQLWNVLTAQGYGLDVWGRIVGVRRNISIPVESTDFLGFSEGVDWQPFDQAPWYTVENAGSVFYLSDPIYRKLILMKALANISRASAAIINQILTTIFGSGGKCYVLDTEQMTMIMIFEFILSSSDRALLLQSNVIPRPAGVGAYYIDGFYPESTFGFSGSGLQPFDQGTFFNGHFSPLPLP
jgi:hypothetical protein